jgi:hypothetical protein
MQVSWAPVAANAAHEPQDIWSLAGVTKPGKIFVLLILKNYLQNHQINLKKVFTILIWSFVLASIINIFKCTDLWL